MNVPTFGHDPRVGANVFVSNDLDPSGLCHFPGVGFANRANDQKPVLKLGGILSAIVPLGFKRDLNYQWFHISYLQTPEGVSPFPACQWRSLPDALALVQKPLDRLSLSLAHDVPKPGVHSICFHIEGPRGPSALSRVVNEVELRPVLHLDSC